METADERLAALQATIDARDADLFVQTVNGLATLFRRAKAGDKGAREVLSAYLQTVEELRRTTRMVEIPPARSPIS